MMPNAPDSYGFLALMRLMERKARGKPRVGKNTTLKEESVSIGQDPSLAFPTHDVSAIEAGKRPQVRNNILGFYGPQGALPLNTTEEVARWLDRGDRAFVAFTDVFATRFLQLFYRSWSDARAITQFDHEEGDRFRHFIGALIGMGTPGFQNRDVFPDINKVYLAPLVIGRVHSPKRLEQMLQIDLGADVQIDEHMLSWMVLEDDNRNRLGQIGSTLGRDMYLGARVPTVNDKIRLNLRTRNLPEYRSFLPGGTLHARLQAIVRWYLGRGVDVDVQLSLPADQMPAAVLGKTAELGWMANLAPPANRTGLLPGASYTLPLNTPNAA
ncbi:MAG: type VI secretion system baseplate subunit TssG [Paracoccaceae bacterium]